MFCIKINFKNKGYELAVGYGGKGYSWSQMDLITFDKLWLDDHGEVYFAKDIFHIGKRSKIVKILTGNF